MAKRKKDLGNLGCSVVVPIDDVHRYIATSSEFATALTGSLRKWPLMHYRYQVTDTNLPQQTTMLLVVPSWVGVQRDQPKLVKEEKVRDTF